MLKSKLKMLVIGAALSIGMAAHAEAAVWSQGVVYQNCNISEGCQSGLTVTPKIVGSSCTIGEAYVYFTIQKACQGLICRSVVKVWRQTCV